MAPLKRKIFSFKPKKISTNQSSNSKIKVKKIIKKLEAKETTLKPKKNKLEKIKFFTRIK
jgi:hypothetical protein